MKFYIKEAREIVGLSQRALAKLIGVAPNTMHGYESGKHDPKSDQLQKIAEACGVTVDFLLTGKEFQPSDKKETPAPKKPKQGAITLEESNALLVSLGYIQPGEDLSDRDLKFLSGVIEILDSWFAERAQRSEDLSGMSGGVK